MALQADAYADLIATSQRNLGKMRWVDLSADLQDYFVLPRLFKKDRVRFDEGTGTQWNILTDDNGSARQDGLYGTDVVDVNDAHIQAYVPWRHTTANYAFDEREMKMNRGAARIVDLTRAKRHMALMSLAKHVERQFFNKPATSADTSEVFGLPYWVVKNANATAGFIGGDPSGFAAGAAGVASATYSRWQNWAGGYTDISKPDLVRKMRKATAFTYFTSPVPSLPGYERQGSGKEILVNYTTLQTFEDLLEEQNENLGNDIASKDGMCTYRKNSVVWVPYLDAQTDNPVFGINWKKFYAVFLADEYMNEGKPKDSPNHHRVKEVHIDMSWNVRCDDRSALWVLSQ